MYLKRGCAQVQNAFFFFLLRYTIITSSVSMCMAVMLSGRKKVVSGPFKVLEEV